MTQEERIEGLEACVLELAKVIDDFIEDGWAVDRLQGAILAEITANARTLVEGKEHSVTPSRSPQPVAPAPKRTAVEESRYYVFGAHDFAIVDEAS